MIGQLTGHSATEDRLFGTLGVAAYAHDVGIDWLRCMMYKLIRTC